MKLTNAVLGRGKGLWHLDGLDEKGVLQTFCRRPIRELLKYCSDDTVMYDGINADEKEFREWCVYGVLFSPTNDKIDPLSSYRNRIDFMNSLKKISGVKFGVVKNGKIKCKL